MTDKEIQRHQNDSDFASSGSARKQGVGEALDMVKAYARQELLDPLSGMPRWMGLGLAGSVGVTVGVVLLLLALLRALQTETGSVFSGNLSWVPYVIAVVALLLLVTVLLRQINKKSLS